MNSSVLNFLLCFSLSFILICHSSLAANADLIANVCKNTIDNSACLSLLRGDPPAASAKTYRQLSKFTLELAVDKATESQNFIKELLKKKQDPSIRPCAFDSYDAVVGSFKSALKELKEDIDTANYDSKIAGDDAQDCQTELESHKIQNPEISSRNKEMMLLSSIAFEVTNMIS